MPAPQGTFIQRLIKWRFLFVVNLLIVLFLSLSLGREVVRHKTIQQEIEFMEEQAQKLATENREMSLLQSALQSESYIEREARLKLGMQLPGETVVVVQEQKAGTKTIEKDSFDPYHLISNGDDRFDQLANRTKWWYYFFNKSAYQDLQSYER
jgi:cell division protein FtsL